MAVDIGAEAINRNSSLSGGYTAINLQTPASESGIITDIDIWANTNITGLRVGTFYLVSGTTYKCRDSEAIAGTITQGSKVTKAVSIAVEVGDYIGCYFTAGKIEQSLAGYAGVRFKAGEYIDPDDETVYSIFAGDAMSLGGYLPAAPTVTTQAVSNISTTTATGHGNITDTGGENCSKRGVCWNTTGSPTVADDKSEETDSFGTGAFTRPMTDLTLGEHYYVRAYAYNSEGYGYGNEVEFDTPVLNVLIDYILRYSGIGPSTNALTRTSDGILYVAKGAYGNKLLTECPIAVYKSVDNGWTWTKDVEFVDFNKAANCQYRVAIAVDGNDKIHLVWSSWTYVGTYHGHLCYATKPKGGSWSAATKLTDYAAGGAGSYCAHSMVIDGLNQPHIFYHRVTRGEHWWYDGSWHMEVVFQGGRLVIDPDNVLYLIYSSTHYAKKDNIPTEVEDTYDTTSLVGTDHTVIYNRMEFKFAGTLRQVKVKTKTAGDYTLRIKSDDGNTTYQTHTIYGASADSWITFDITELELAANDRYRMEVTRPAGASWSEWPSSYLYNGVFWYNIKASFETGGDEHNNTHAMGFVLLQKSGWSTNAIPDDGPALFVCDKDGNLHFYSGTQYRKLSSSGVWGELEAYGPVSHFIVDSLSVTQDGVVHIEGRAYAIGVEEGRHYQRSVAGDWSYTVLFDFFGVDQGNGATFLHAIFPVFGTYYPCLLESGYAFAYKTGSSNLRFTSDPEIPSPPAVLVSTNPASAVGQTTATLNGTLDYDGGVDCECNFEWGLDTGYGITTPIQSKRTSESFSQILGGLEPNTTYHFRAIATNIFGTSYGADRSFTTGLIISKAYALAREEL